MGVRPAPDDPDTRSQRTRRILEAPIPGLLLRLSAPTVALAGVQVVVLIADAWFLGRLGTTALASVALVYPVQALMQMMSAGAMGGGISSAVARALGRGDRDGARARAVHGLVIAVGMAAAFALIGGVLADPLFALLGGRDTVLEGAVAYAQVLFGGGLSVWLANSLASILRGSGSMALPGMVLLVAALAQIPLAGALTLGVGAWPGLGVTGPAVALVLTSSVAALVMAVAVLGVRAPLSLRSAPRSLRQAAFADILRVGAVACGNALLTVATVIIVTRIAAAQGTAALAGYGLGARLELMLVPVAFGVGATLTATVGTHFGARRYARARRIARWGSLAVAGITTAVGLVFAARPELWLGSFSAEAAVLAVGAIYLGIVGPWFGFFGLGMALYFASQGTGDMRWPIIAGIARLLVAAGGGALAASAFGFQGLFAGVAAGLVVFGGIIALSLRSRVWNPG